MNTVPLPLERCEKISDLCGTILSSNKNILMVAAVNKLGRLIGIKHRDESVKIELTDKELEILFMQSMLQYSMLRDFDNKFGISKYLLVERETLSEFVFPLVEGIIIVLCNINTQEQVLARKLSKTVNEFVLWSEAEKLK